MISCAAEARRFTHRSRWESEHDGGKTYPIRVLLHEALRHIETSAEDFKFECLFYCPSDKQEQLAKLLALRDFHVNYDGNCIKIKWDHPGAEAMADEASAVDRFDLI
jgi:hypothetical protein